MRSALLWAIAMASAAAAFGCRVSTQHYRTLLAHRSSESYIATIAALDRANTALEYHAGDEDRVVDLSGFQVEWPVQEKLPDLPTARNSIDDAILAAPNTEKTTLLNLAKKLSGPGLHQNEKTAITYLRNDYVHKQSAQDITTFELQNAEKNTGTASLILASIAICSGIASYLLRKK